MTVEEAKGVQGPQRLVFRFLTTLPWIEREDIYMNAYFHQFRESRRYKH